MAALIRYGEERHAPRDGGLLRYRSGQPLTYRRYDGLWERIGEHLPWVRTQGISAHWIRYTTLTWVERNFGMAVAHAYAGHLDGTGDTGKGTVTMTYVRATLADVCAALAALTGEPPSARHSGSVVILMASVTADVTVPGPPTGPPRGETDRTASSTGDQFCGAPVARITMIR
jgi:hypothetical protein